MYLGCIFFYVCWKRHVKSLSKCDLRWQMCKYVHDQLTQQHFSNSLFPYFISYNHLFRCPISGFQYLSQGTLYHEFKIPHSFENLDISFSYVGFHKGSIPLVTSSFACFELFYIAELKKHFLAHKFIQVKKRTKALYMFRSEKKIVICLLLHFLVECDILLVKEFSHISSVFVTENENFQITFTLIVSLCWQNYNPLTQNLS